ncbi:pyridoxal-dependent decarboxylase [Russula brevipes]|nr:pyridoxal-dependent decarboxylase [Russula brevipes]
MALGCILPSDVCVSVRSSGRVARRVSSLGATSAVPLSLREPERVCVGWVTRSAGAQTSSASRTRGEREKGPRTQGEAGSGAACQSEERASREKEREVEGTEEAWREKRAARAAAKATNPVTAIASEPNADRPPVSNVPDPPAADSSTPQDTNKPVTSSTPDPYVLRLLAALGTGFDCASNGEIVQVLRLGVGSERIIFANPCKAVSFIKTAAKHGVDTMTFDNADELYKVARANPTAKLVLRILTNDSKSLCRLGLKFGTPLVAVPGLLAIARYLGLDVIGISFHVGSGCYDPSAFSDAVRCARAAFDMGLAAGYKFSLLDVGGGFEDTTFEATAGVLSDAIDSHFPDRVGLQIIAEPQ